MSKRSKKYTERTQAWRNYLIVYGALKRDPRFVLVAPGTFDLRERVEEVRS